MKKASGELTQLLKRIAAGDIDSVDALWREVYQELHKMAEFQLKRARPSETLRPTALVNEAYLRLMKKGRAEFNDRTHFFAVAGTIMRHILVDYARQKDSWKRGGRDIKVAFDEAFGNVSVPADGIEIVVINDLIDKIAEEDEIMANILELKYFGGLNVDEIATAVGVSVSTVKRKWSAAKLWLYHELSIKKTEAG